MSRAGTKEGVLHLGSVVEYSLLNSFSCEAIVHLLYFSVKPRLKIHWWILYCEFAGFFSRGQALQQLQ